MNTFESPGNLREYILLRFGVSLSLAKCKRILNQKQAKAFIKSNPSSCRIACWAKNQIYKEGLLSAGCQPMPDVRLECDLHWNWPAGMPIKHFSRLKRLLLRELGTGRHFRCQVIRSAISQTPQYLSPIDTVAAKVVKK